MNYQKLFNYMNDEHKVALVETDMIEIVRIVNEMQKPDEPQPKTIREWFEELPEPYRSEAIKNCKKSNIRDLLSVVKPSISASIYSGFVWSESAQGHEYWSELHQKLSSENK